MQSNSRKRCLCFAIYSMSAWAISRLEARRARLYQPVAAGGHGSHWPSYRLWLAAWYIPFVPNEDGSPLLLLSLLSASSTYFSSSCHFLWFWTAAPRKSVLLSLLRFRWILMEFTGTVVWYYQIVKLYYCGLLGVIYCRENGPVVVGDGWYGSDWWISIDLAGHMLLPQMIS